MKKTDISLRNKIIYSVYLRNHTEQGTFKALDGDLDRIKALGADIIWLLPIHPIGKLNKKGELGCPYSISDYRGINPEYGTLADFKHLVDEIHARDMLCIIDVVYNHTSHDSLLRAEHPEYFYKNSDGEFGNRYGDWTDVIDLDYTNTGLWHYQIESLKMWAGIVDGFRCDVASCVPAKFWEIAVEAVASVNPNAIWLAESVYIDHIRYARSMGYPIATDSDLYNAFDMEYPYDIQDYFNRYTEGTGKLSEYTRALTYQEHIFKSDYIKVRFLENHDTPRAAKIFPDENIMKNWLAFVYFQKGTTMLYGGQEWQNEEYCTLFDKAVFERDPKKDISEYMTKLGEIKKSMLPVDADFSATADDENGIVTAYLVKPDSKAVGVFCMKNIEKEAEKEEVKPTAKAKLKKNTKAEAAPEVKATVEIAVDIPDGAYTNEITGCEVNVTAGKLVCDGQPIIINVK